MGRPRWRSWAGLPGVLAAVLPKATCPLCVAAYAGALSGRSSPGLRRRRAHGRSFAVDVVVASRPVLDARADCSERRERR